MCLKLRKFGKVSRKNSDFTLEDQRRINSMLDYS